MASNLGYQWEVLTFDQSIMRVDLLHSIGREETHFTVTLHGKQNGVGPRYSWEENRPRRKYPEKCSENLLGNSSFFP